MSNVLLLHFTYCTYAYNYVYMHTCTHAQFHVNRLTAGTYYTHLRTHIHTQCHAPSHSKIVYSTLLVISPFPCTMRSWASAVFGGSALVEKVLNALNCLMYQILFALCTRKYSFDASPACSQSYLPTLLRQLVCNKGRAKMCTTWWPTNALSAMSRWTRNKECRCSRSLTYGTDTVSMFITWFSFVEMATLLKDRGARRWNSVAHKTAVNDFPAHSFFSYVSTWLSRGLRANLWSGRP